jgi:two-component system chemotaxis response regulator CheY
MRRVLVVDDSATIRTIVKATIEVHAPKGTVSIDEAASAEEALSQLSAGPVDLMLVDWNMPRTDGLSLVKQLRSRGSEMPIIMVSAVSDAPHIQEAKRAGVTDYVTKPFQMAELWSRIRAHLD